jgi:membrane dipeptidase
VDTHNDILMKAVEKGYMFDTDLSGKANSDLTRWRTGGLDVQVFSVYCDGDMKNAFAFANREMDSLDAVIARNPGLIIKAAGYRDIKKTVRKHQLAAMFGVEGGHMIEDDLSKLNALYDRGARYLTLTHNISPSWATSAADETKKKDLPHKGLTDFGKQVVKRMNDLGMLIDVSHAGDQTFWDIINTTTKPIIASHSSVYALVPHRRNLKDEQIRAIAKNGGVIQVNFNPGFIDTTVWAKEDSFLARHRVEYDSLIKAGVGDFYGLDYLYEKYPEEMRPMQPPLSKLIDHIDYIARLVGVDYVGLGSDFDGINLTPQQLDDVTTYPLITKALMERGYRKNAIKKIMGGNFLRVLKANERK